jgi:hypothetical protein
VKGNLSAATNRFAERNRLAVEAAAIALTTIGNPSAAENLLEAVASHSGVPAKARLVAMAAARHSRVASANRAVPGKVVLENRAGRAKVGREAVLRNKAASASRVAQALAAEENLEKVGSPAASAARSAADPAARARVQAAIAVAADQGVLANPRLRQRR